MPKQALIVEDSDLNLALYGKFLEAAGFTVAANRDGRRVAEDCRSRRPDLILLDIQLPDVSGLDIARQLKADPDLRSIPIIAITTLAEAGDEESIRKAGCDAYVPKPISRDSLMTAVAKLTGS
jgi:two-component system cell cycle response regulator DivK